MGSCFHILSVNNWFKFISDEHMMWSVNGAQWACSIFHQLISCSNCHYLDGSNIEISVILFIEQMDPYMWLWWIASNDYYHRSLSFLTSYFKFSDCYKIVKHKKETKIESLIIGNYNDDDALNWTPIHFWRIIDHLNLWIYPSNNWLSQIHDMWHLFTSLTLYINSL